MVDFDSVYKNQVGELAAHQISTILLLIVITVYLWFLARKWSLKSSKQAWFIGGMWFIMTEVFEFGMGRFLLNKSWNKLFYVYNVFDGQIWLFIPLWVLIGPYIYYRNIKNKSSET